MLSKKYNAIHLNFIFFQLCTAAEAATGLPVLSDLDHAAVKEGVVERGDGPMLIKKYEKYVNHQQGYMMNVNM
jgi:hypothetical protein